MKGQSDDHPVFSYGAYSIILNEIYGKLEAKGLNPYFGFMHSDREKHPTLASDLMEEWRAVIVDATAMSLVNGHEIERSDFYEGDDGGVFLNASGFKIFIKKMENKLNTDSKYLETVDYRVNFRRAMDIQINSFCHAMEQKDSSLYLPMQIR